MFSSAPQHPENEEVMKRQLFAGLAAATAVTASLLFASGASAAVPDPTAAAAAAAQIGGGTPNAKLPVDIQVNDKDNKIVASLIGVGKQIYDCNAAGTGYAFREPAAGLFTSRGVPAAIHGKGPFWTNFDGSHVDGALIKSVAPPKPADLNKNVAWLLLAGTQPTPNTTGVFSKVTFIQRLDTRGGVAPAGPCTVPSTVAVDYSANYVFWAPK
jgi:hypothetical protein